MRTAACPRIFNKRTRESPGRCPQRITATHPLGYLRPGRLSHLPAVGLGLFPPTATDQSLENLLVLKHRFSERLCSFRRISGQQAARLVDVAWQSAGLDGMASLAKERQHQRV